MAGYYISSIDNEAFIQLTTTPTIEQGLILADVLLVEMEYYVENEFHNPSDADIWPRERNALAEIIIKRLASSDWYSDLSMDNANMWDQVVCALQDDAFGLDNQLADYESIYWDCAEIAAANNAHSGRRMHRGRRGRAIEEFLAVGRHQK